VALKKQLGLIDIFSIAAGAMISSGLFVLPGIVFSDVGPAIIISYALAGVFMIPTLLTKAELSTAMPKAGGTYFFVIKSMGPIGGMIGGLSSWLSIALKSAFALIGMGAIVKLFNPGLDYNTIKLIAAGLTVVFTLINIISIKGAIRLQVILVVSLLIILGLYSILGIRYSHHAYYTPFFYSGWRDIFGAAGMIFISYGGLTKVASIAEEVKNPGVIIPRGMFLAFGVVSLLYVISVGLTIGLINPEQLKQSLTPLSLGAKNVLGIPGEVVMTLAALAAFITTANAGILSASRVPFAMARDNLLPVFFSSLTRRKIPAVSISITGLFMLICILFLDIKSLVKVASTMQIILFIMVNISIIIFRQSKLSYYKPVFKSVLYPYIQIAGIIVYGFLIFEMGKIPVLFTCGFFVFAVVWYFVYARNRARGLSVFSYLLKKLEAKEIAGKDIEKELMEIIKEREEIVEDRFDREIKKAEILDLEGPMGIEEFFRIVSRKISERTGIDEKKVLQLLMEREKVSSTVIKTGLAIPHIILPGEKSFAIIPVRCRNGILYPGEEDPVYIAFVLAGSVDERKMHLKSLMAIAQIMQTGDFVKKWIEAETVEELRSLLLFSRRDRG